MVAKGKSLAKGKDLPRGKKLIVVAMAIWRFTTIRLLGAIALLGMSSVVTAGENRVLYILQYHHIATDTPRATSTSPLLFEKHLIHLETEGYRVVRLSEALKKLLNGESLPEKAVAITFDDGYESVYRNAFPILRPHGFPFTVFVNPDMIDGGSTEHISWEQAKEMADSGAEYGNHTIGHIHMIDRADNETMDQWRIRVRDAVTVAESRIQELFGYSLKLLAYPYGEYSPDVTDMLRELNYIGLGQQSGPVGPESDRLAIPRFPLPDDYGSMESFTEKLRTLPLNPEAIKPDSHLITDDNPPALSFATSVTGLNRINCYGSGQGRIQTEVLDNRLRVVGNQAFSSRRFRYNCTASAGGGMFFWHSFNWINPAVSEK